MVVVLDKGADNEVKDVDPKDVVLLQFDSSTGEVEVKMLVLVVEVPLVELGEVSEKSDVADALLAFALAVVLDITVEETDVVEDAADTDKTGTGIG